MSLNRLFGGNREAPGARLRFMPLDSLNPWLAAAEGAKRQIPAWLALPVAAVIVLAAVRLGVPAARGVLGYLDGSTPVAGVWRSALIYLIVYGPFYLWAVLALRWEGRLPLNAPSRVRWAAAGVGLGLLGAGLSVLVAALEGAVASAPHATSEALTTAALGALFVLFQAGGEEVLFRGWLQPLCCVRWGVWPGAIATAVLFAASHAVDSGQGVLSLINLLLAGLFFGLLALRTGGLAAAIGAHTAWNWLEACGLGLDENPVVGRPLGLLHLAFQGSPLWSGGPEGLNGSLAETLVLSILALSLSARLKRPPTTGTTP